MSTEDNRDRKRHRSNGKSRMSSTKRAIEGPGVWVTCVKGKEKTAVGEVYDLFDSLSESLWPSESGKSKVDDDAKAQDSASDDEEEDVEKAIAKEVASMKRPRKEQRFANCPTNTACVIYISCQPPVDPVAMIEHYLQGVERTGVTNTRYARRFVPVSGTCEANLPDVIALMTRIVETSPFNEDSDESFRYKINLRIRNHTILQKDEVIKELARCVPRRHVVDLQNAELFVLAEVFKGLCTIAIVRNYDRFKKFNVTEVSQAATSKNMESSSGRVKNGEGAESI